MRTFIATLSVSSVLLATGCNTWLHRGNGAVADNTPPAGEQVPTNAQDLVVYLNACSTRINSLQSYGMYMDCKAQGQSVGLNANMVCQKPRDFRLRATIAGQSACDIGSNNQEFWYWIKQDDQPYLYHCSYDAMAQGNVRLPFPFQPDMVVAALGMGEYNPDASRYEVKVLPKTVELSERTLSAQGKPVTKVTVFARSKVDQRELAKGRPQVIEYKLLNAQGQEECKATVDRVVYQSGAIVPQHVRVTWPAAKMEMALTLNSVKVNLVDAGLARNAFNRADLPYKPFDLARGALDGSSTSIQRVRGSMH